ncbi:MAG: hypothetical protein QXV35_00720 [Archaeoglobaceae archaeon]
MEEVNRKNKEAGVSIVCPVCGEYEFRFFSNPDTVNRFICPGCKTPIYVCISPKMELITLRPDEICEECRGTGKCPECDGSGCDKCRGTGKCPDCAGTRIKWSR